MFKPPPLDISADLRLTIGPASVQVTPRMGLALAESLLRVSVREIAREERERVDEEADRRRMRMDQVAARAAKPRRSANR